MKRYASQTVRKPALDIDPAVAADIHHFDPLTPTDRAVIEGLAQLNRTPREILPDSTPVSEILPSLELCCGAMRSIEVTDRKISPLIGRLMILVRQNKPIFERLGYKSFNAFCRGHLAAIGYQRSTVYIAMRMVELHPALTVGDWVGIGVMNLSLLSKFCKSTDPSYAEYIAAAKNCTCGELSMWLHRRGLIEAGDTHSVPVTFTATRTVANHLNKFVADPRVQETVGSSDTGRIVEAMIQSCSGEWLQETAPVLPSGVSWRCDWCQESGNIDLRTERTLIGVGRMVAMDHQEKSENCDFVDKPGELIIFLNRD